MTKRVILKIKKYVDSAYMCMLKQAETNLNGNFVLLVYLLYLSNKTIFIIYFLAIQKSLLHLGYIPKKSVQCFG